VNRNEVLQPLMSDRPSIDTSSQSKKGGIRYQMYR